MEKKQPNKILKNSRLHIKKNKIIPFATTWIQLEIIILSEISQTKTIPYDNTYTWNLKYDTNEPMKQKQNHGHREENCGCQGGEVGVAWSGKVSLADGSFYI